MFERRLGAVGAALVFEPAVVAAGGVVSQCRWDNSLECEGDSPECDYTDTAACPDSGVVSMLGECIEHNSQYGRYSTRCECIRAVSARLASFSNHRRAVRVAVRRRLRGRQCVGNICAGSFLNAVCYWALPRVHEVLRSSSQGWPRTMSGWDDSVIYHSAGGEGVRVL